MSALLKVFTSEQLFILMRDDYLANGGKFTDFNEGSDPYALFNSVTRIASQISFDFLDTTRLSIPIALYDGLDFEPREATKATGFMRFFRLPLFLIRYTGADSSCELTISPTQLTTVTSGTPGDDLTLSLVTYPTTQDLVTIINSHGSYTAILVGLGNELSINLYQYVSSEIVDKLDYLNVSDSHDVMNQSALLVSIVVAQASIDNLIFQTTEAKTIAAGDATSEAIASESVGTGPDNNIQSQAIDTLNGKGFIVTPISGANHVINDSAFSGGQNEETREEQAERFKIHSQGLNAGTNNGIKREIFEKVTTIKAVNIRDNYPSPGYATIIADDGTGNLTTIQVTAIELVLDGDPEDLVTYPGKGTAGITYNIEAPNIVEQDVVITVFRVGDTTDEDEIKTSVQSAIEQYINTLRLGHDIVLNKIRTVAMKSHIAVYDVSISDPVANVSINDSSIARTGAGTSATVTVTISTLPSQP